MSSNPIFKLIAILAGALLLQLFEVTAFKTIKYDMNGTGVERPIKSNQVPWEFRITNFVATTRAPGHRGNLTVEFDVRDVFDNPPVTSDEGSTKVHCNATFSPSGRNAEGIIDAGSYPSKQSSPANCSDGDWIWYFRKYQGAADFALNLEHMATKKSVGPRPAVYYGTGPEVNADSKPPIDEYCTGSGYCDYWVNSTLVVPITSASA